MSIISRPQPNRPGIRLRAGLRRCETLQATKQPIPRQLFKPMGIRWCKDGTYYHTKLSVWRTEADSRSLAREGGTREPGPRPLLAHFPFGKKHSWIKVYIFFRKSAKGRRKNAFLNFCPHPPQGIRSESRYFKVLSRLPNTPASA